MDIAHVVSLIGSQAKVARICGVSPQAVSQWIQPPGTRRHRPVPARCCVRLANALNGEVELSDLRPDVWPPAPANQENRDVA